MNKDKWIEELAEAIFQNCNCGIFFSEANKIADFVINKQNYSKASEIFEEVRKSLPIGREFNSSEIAMGYEWALADVRKAIAELKKKYIGKDTNVTIKESEK